MHLLCLSVINCEGVLVLVKTSVFSFSVLTLSPHDVCLIAKHSVHVGHIIIVFQCKQSFIPVKLRGCVEDEFKTLFIANCQC